MAARKHQSNCFKKTTPKFVGELQTMIDKDSNESIRDMEVSEFLIKQVMHEDIHYFSYKMRKRQCLSQAMMDKRPHCKTFEPTPASPPTSVFFSRWEKFLPGSDELTELLACSVPTGTRWTNIDEKQVYIMVFGVVTNGDIPPWSQSTWRPTSSSQCCFGSGGWLLEDPTPCHTNRRPLSLQHLAMEEKYAGITEVVFIDFLNQIRLNADLYAQQLQHVYQNLLRKTPAFINSKNIVGLPW